MAKKIVKKAKRKNPPKPVTKRARPTSGSVTPDTDVLFGDNLYEPGQLKETSGENVIYDKRHSALYVSDGKGGVQTSTKFEFWVEDVTYGFGATGEAATSHFYDAQYHRSFNLKPYHVRGRVPTEKYYDYMAEYIAKAQYDMARGRPRMRLIIPAANIAVFGFIPVFRGGHAPEGGGFEVAPVVEFDFVETYNKRAQEGRTGKVSTQLVSYFLDPKQAYWNKQEDIYLGELFGEGDPEIVKADELRKQARRLETSLTTATRNIVRNVDEFAEDIADGVIDFFTRFGD